MDFDVAFKNFVSLLLRKDRFATLLEALQRPVEVGVVDDERDEDANDVASPGGEQQETAFARFGDDALDGAVGIRCRPEFHRHHRAQAANVSDRFGEPAP